MTHKTILSIFLAILIAIPTTSIPSHSTTNNTVDLGTVTIATEQDAIDLFNTMLEKEKPAAYQVIIVNSGKLRIDLHKAMLKATESHTDSPYYFRPNNLYKVSGGTSLFYVDQVDFILKNTSEFERFLSDNAGRTVLSTKFKLCNYEANKNYPYNKTLGLIGNYEIKDKVAYGDVAIRTLKPYILTENAPTKVYTITSDSELETALIESVHNFYEKIMIVTQNDMSTQTIQQTLKQLQMKNSSPQFDFYSGFYILSRGNVHTIQFYYDYTPDMCKTLLQEAQTIAKDVVSKLITADLNDYEKAKKLHDFIIETTRYDDYAYRFDLGDSRVHDFVGPFFDHNAVCSGYASAYRMLLDEAGLENYMVVGSGETVDSPREDHAWNIVKINNQYYHIDTTWDDQNASALRYRYFAISDVQIMKDHTWDVSMYPVCTDNSLEYFAKNNLKVDSKAAFNTFVHTKLEAGSLDFDLQAIGLDKVWLNGEISLILNQLYPDGYTYTYSKFDNFYNFNIKPKGSIIRSSKNPKISKLNFNDIAIKAGLYVTVGDSGALATSTNGQDWIIRRPPTSTHLLSIANNNKLFIAAGAAGTLIKSSNGVEWAKIPSPITTNIRKIAYLNNKFWLVGDKGLIASSPDGNKWTVSKPSTKVVLNDIIYVQKQYVVVGQRGTLLTSSMGSKWTQKNTGTSTELMSIAYGNGYFLTGGRSSTMLKSKNLTSWRNVKYNYKVQFNRLIYTNQSFYAIGESERFIFNVDDTYRYIQGRPNLNGILANGAYFFIVGDGGQLYKSEKGSIQTLFQTDIKE